MKKISTVVGLLIIIVVLYFWFHKPTPLYSNDKEQQYYNTIVSVLNGTTVESFSPATPLGPSNS